MKKNLKVSTSFLLVFFQIALVWGQHKVIPIGDRVDLPSEIYDSLKSYDVLLCGEFHGTNESPQFMEGLVKLWTKKGEKVILALEVEETNQPSVDSFLASGDFSIIRRMQHFIYKSKYGKDGRSSIAMATLIRNMYGLGGTKIKCFDTKAKIKTGQQRDSLMAINVANTILNNPGYKIILLAGNIHTMMKKGYPRHPDYLPMGYFLKQNPALARFKITCMDIVYGSGTAWYCRNDTCGEKELLPNVSSAYFELSNADNVFCMPTGNETQYADNKNEKGDYWDYYSRELGYKFVFASKYITASKPLNE